MGFTNIFPGATERVPSGRVIKIRSAETRKEVQTLSGHDGGVEWLAFLPKGKKLISSGGDGYFRAWDVATGWELWKAKGGGGLAVTPDGKRLLAYEGGNLVIWGLLENGLKKVHEQLAPRQGGPMVAVTAPDGKTALIDGRYDEMWLWGLETHEVRKKYTRTDSLTVGFGQPAAFHRDGASLAVTQRAGNRSFVVLLDFTDKELQRFAEGTATRPRDITFSSDGKTLVCRDDQGKMHAWDVQTGKPKWRLTNSGLSGGGVFVFSPNGMVALSAKGYRSHGTGDLQLLLWDTVHGQLIGDLSAPRFP